MLILSLNSGHNASVVVAEDYNILFAIQKERATRQKNHGGFPDPQLLATALGEVNRHFNQIDALLVPHGHYPYHLFDFPSWLKLRYAIPRIWGRDPQINIATRHKRYFDVDAIARTLGLSSRVNTHIYRHHLAHALSALFFSDWDDALIYTADGGGDNLYYSAYSLQNQTLDELDGFETRVSRKGSSLGLAYGYMTEALGFKMNQHEGKLTGLAAYGEPEIYPALSRLFSVDDTGTVLSHLRSNRELRRKIYTLAENVSPENCAASIQVLLEETILKSIQIYLERTGARHVGLAGGVFANVALNRKIAQLPGVEELFVFPGMGDEGLAVGGLFEFLLRKDGLRHWLKQRHRLRNVYWGTDFNAEVKHVLSSPNVICQTSQPTERAAQLLAANKVVAIFDGRMEFGPRALGARSILANPSDSGMNDVLNGRLGRTEFMPFAPCILDEHVDRVFELDHRVRYAMRFMTITCLVRGEWRSKIPAVVHVDGTARPQIVIEDESPLYAEVLRKFHSITGLPVLINTSFNVHEEPIVHAPAECLQAIQDERVDYVLTAHGLYSKR